MREPGWYWCTVEWRTNMVPLYWGGAGWSFGDSDVRKPVAIGPKIEEPIDTPSKER